MLIGIISPTDQEMQVCLDFMQDIKEEAWKINKIYTGKYHSIEIVAIRCGMGKVNAALAAQKLIDEYKLDGLVICGVAGSIYPLLKIGDVVINDKICYHDVDNQMVLIDSYPNLNEEWFYTDEELLDAFKVIEEKDFDPQAQGFNLMIGCGVTGEQFITEDGRDDIEERYHPLTVDMETGAVAHAAYVNDIPFASIRSITDTPYNAGLGTFLENLELASKNAALVLELFFRKISI